MARDISAKETFAMKLDPELISELKQLQGEYSSGQDFGEALLLALKEQRVNTETEAPLREEQLRVRKSLLDIERIVGATLELAASDKVKAEESAAQKVAEAQAEVLQLKDTIKGQLTKIEELKLKTIEQAKQIKSLEQSSESIASLKDAWGEKEHNLTTRIAELDSEAKEARALKTLVSELKERLSELEKTNIQLQHQNDLTARDTEIEAHKQFRGEKDNLIEKYEKQIQELNAEIRKLLFKNRGLLPECFKTSGS